MLAAATLVAAAAGCASPTSASSGGSGGGGSAASADIKIGIITAKSGPYAAYGAEYLAGLKAGLDYVTHGSGKIAGHKIDLLVEDDADKPTTAVSEAKDLIGQGVTLIGGSVDSAIALQVAAVAAQNKVIDIAGRAATDKLDGLNRYTFRSGRESYQDIATAGAFVGDLTGKKVVVLAQNSEFGTANAAGVKAVRSGSLEGISARCQPAGSPGSASATCPRTAWCSPDSPSRRICAWPSLPAKCPATTSCTNSSRCCGNAPDNPRAHSPAANSRCSRSDGYCSDRPGCC